MGIKAIEQWAEQNLAKDSEGHYVEPSSNSSGGNGGTGSGSFKAGGNPWEKAAKAWMVGGKSLADADLMDPWMERELNGGKLSDAWEEAKARFSPSTDAEELSFDNFDSWLNDYKALADRYNNTFWGDTWADEATTQAYNDEAQEEALRLQARYEEFGNFFANHQIENAQPGDYYFNRDVLDSFASSYDDMIGDVAKLGHMDQIDEGSWTYLHNKDAGISAEQWYTGSQSDYDTAQTQSRDLQKQIDEIDRQLKDLDLNSDTSLYDPTTVNLFGRPKDNRAALEKQKADLERQKAEADAAMEAAAKQMDFALPFRASEDVKKRLDEKKAGVDKERQEAAERFGHEDRWWDADMGPLSRESRWDDFVAGEIKDVGYADVTADLMDELLEIGNEWDELQKERAALEAKRLNNDTSLYDPTTVNLYGTTGGITDEEYNQQLADIEAREKELADRQKLVSADFGTAKMLAQNEDGYQEAVERGQVAYDQFAEDFRERWIENSDTKNAILQDMADRAETDANFLGAEGAFQLGDAYARSRREKNLADVSIGEDWTDDEANWYRWLMGNDKQDEAFAYAESLNRFYNDKALSEDTALARQGGAGYAMDEDYNALRWAGNTGRGLLGFAGSIATMPDQFVSWMDKVATTALSESAFDGNGYYAGRRNAWLSDQANAWLSGRAQQMNENGGTLGDEWGFLAGKGWGDAYQLANSMVQSYVLGTGLTSAYMAGGLEQAAAAEIAEVATLAGFFGQAANSAFDEAIQRGANANQATYISMLSGVAEVAGEKFSLENLLNREAWMGNWFADLFMQGTIEGSEEGFTNLLNIFGDEISARLSGGKTEMEQELAELMSSGMSYKEASKKIWRDMAFETAFDVLGGFLSGGLSGAPMQAVHAAWGQTNYKGEGRNSQGSLLQEARSKGGETAKLADEYDGKRFTKQRAENLKQSIADADIGAIENAAKRQLQARDSNLTDEQAERLAKAVLAAAQGEADAGQQELLNRDNKFGTGEASRLVFELQTGVYTNEHRTWLNDLNTTRVTLDQTERSRQATHQAENLPASFDRGVTVNGEALTITGISKDGAVQAKNSKGETVTVDKADLSADQRSTVDTLTNRYGTQAGAVLRVMQTATGDFATLGKAADMIYTVATNSSKDFDAGMLRRNLPTYTQYFNDEQMKALWDAARFKRAQDQQSQQKRFTRHAVKDRVVGEKYEVRDGGKLYVFEGADLNSAELTDDQKATIRLAGVLTSAAKGRLQINFFHGGDSGFFGQYQNGRIDLNIDRINEAGKSMVTLTLAHELTHFIQDFNAAGYNKLKTFMIDKLMDSTGKSMEQLIKEKQARQIGLDRQGAIDEIIADGCEMMLQDGSLIDELGKIDRKLAVKVKDFVKDFLDRLSQELTAKHYEATELGKYVKEQQELWNKALTEAMQSGKAQNKTKAARQSQTAEKQYSLNDVDIDRNYINYGDETSENQAVKDAVQNLRAQGKYVNISARDAAAFNGIDYSDFKKARGSFKKILERFLGKTIELIHEGGMAQVYLTRKGINHAAVTDYTPGKAAVYSKLRKMIQNSVYAYSSQNDPHAVDQAEGKTEWDAFVALARFGKYEFPTVFKFRTTDSDVRSQLYNIVSKREIGASHGAGLQTQNGQPNYGLMPISDDTITQNDVESKGQMSKENAPVKQQFSMADAVEQTDRLVAIHNKSLSGLQRMLERGGVPFPSIAIKKAGTSHEGFGDVSIVFPRETIDPEASKWNRLYSNDAWTPTEPRTEYDVGDTWKLRQQFEKLLGEKISDDVYDSYMKGFHARLYALTEQASLRQTAEALDGTQQTLLEAIRDAKTKKQMDNILRKNAQWIQYSSELTEDLWALKQDVQNMPAPYFEAKPRRVVNLEEALAYILPDTADAALIESMRQRGLNVVTYEAENSADRLDKLNSVEGAQFSREDRYTYEALIEKDPIRVVEFQAQEVPVKGHGRKARVDEGKLKDSIIPDTETLHNPPAGDMHYVYVSDIGGNVIVNRYSVSHGTRGQITNSGTIRTAEVTFALPEILRNSIAVNELGPRVEEGVEYGYILFGVGLRSDGKAYLVRSTVNHFKDNRSILKSVEIYDFLKGIKAKMIDAGDLRSHTANAAASLSTPDASIKIKVADLLDFVKDEYPEFLPNSVREHYGLTGEKAEGTMFSREDVAEEDLAQKLAESEAARGKLEKAIQTAQRQLEFWRNEADQPGKKGIYKANPRDVQRFAKGLLEEYPYTTVKASQITERIQKIADGFMNQEDTGDLYRIALEVAEEIIENSYVRIDNEMNLVGLNGTTDADLIKQQLKGYIYVAEQDRADIAAQLGEDSFEQVRRRFFKYGIYLTNDLGKATKGNSLRAIDTLYEEMAPFYGWKSGVTTIAEMMEIIDAAITEDVVNPYYDVSSELSHMDIDYVAELAETIFEGAISEDVRQYFTRAERAARQLDEAKANAAEQKLQARERLEAERENNRQALKRERQRTADVRKRLAATRATDAARLRALREQKNRRMNEIIQEERRKRRDLINRNRENRARRETREKIWKLQKEAQQMISRPTEKAYVPANLMRAMAEMLSVVSSAELRQQESRMDRIDRQLEEMSMSEEQHGKKAAYIQRAIDRLGDLQAKYEAISKDEMYAYTYNEAVNGMLNQLKTYLYGTHLTDGDMSADTLKQIYNIMNALMYTVKNANKMTAMEYQHGIREFATKFNHEMDHADAKRGIAGVMQQSQMWQMRPDTFFSYLCGYAKDNAGTAIQKMFVEGTERKLNLQRTFYNMFREITESKNASERKQYDAMVTDPLKNMVDWGIKDINGNSVVTPRGMMLQAYMLLEQEDSARSLAIGGFRLPNMTEYYHGNIAASYGKFSMLTENHLQEYSDLLHEARRLRESMEGKTEAEQAKIEEQIKQVLGQANEVLAAAQDHMEVIRQGIEEQLTDFDKKIIQAARQWYDYSGRKLDETNMDLYGFKKSRPKGYVPIHRDTTSVTSVDIRDSQNTVNLEGAGFTKSRVKSTSPILLTDIFVELDGNQNRMSNFYGFVKVQRDFNAIWKCKTPETDLTIEGKIAEKFGKGQQGIMTNGTQYVENYIRSIAGGAQDVHMLTSLYGNAAAATLSLNPKVAVSQLASIPTAAAELGWGAVAKGLARGLRTGVSTKAKQELADKSVWFWQRYRGEGGMREFAEIKNNRGTAVGRLWNRVANTPVGAALLGWCQDMDVLATASMWAMAEEAAKAKGVDISTEAGQQAVGDIYRDVIRKTQPNYTATERSDLLRDKREIAKFLTMYKTQSNQNLNILIEATGEFNRMKRDLKAGRNGVTQEDMRQATVKLANSYTAVVLGGSLAYAALRTIVSFLMGALSGYRDDDDELTAASITKGTMLEAASSLAGMSALGGIAYDIFYSGFSGDKYYGISDSALSAISDTASNTAKMIQAIMDDEKGNEWEAISRELKSLFTLAGIPLGNAGKFLDASKMWYNDLRNGTFGQFEGNVERKPAQEAHRLLNALRDGDEEKAAELFQALQDSQKGGTDWKRRQQAESFVTNQVKTWYVDDADLTEDQAREILTTYGGMTEDEANEQLREWLGIIENGYDYGDAKDAFISGDLSEDELRIYAASYMGLKGQELEDAVTNLSCERDTGYAYKDLMQAYVDGAISEQEAVDYRMKYGGYNKAEAEDTVTRWRCEKETGVAYSRLEDAFVDGVLTNQQAVALQVKYGGLTEDKAKEAVTKWACEKDTGVKYSGIEEAYIAGKITRQQVVAWEQKYGGRSKDKAEEYLARYDFAKKTGVEWSQVHEGFKTGRLKESDLLMGYKTIAGMDDEKAHSYVEIAKWIRDVDDEFNFDKYQKWQQGEERLVAAGVSKILFAQVAEAWADDPSLKSEYTPEGKLITDSKMKKVMAYIGKLDIPAEQKTALAYSFYKDGKKIKKYKTW